MIRIRQVKILIEQDCPQKQKEQISKKLRISENNISERFKMGNTK